MGCGVKKNGVFNMKDFVSRGCGSRVGFKNFEITQKVLKSLIFNTNLSTLVQRKLLWQFSRLCFLSSIVYVKNRCILSGRSGGVYCYFNLSRLVIKRFYRLQYLPGLRKSSW